METLIAKMFEFFAIAVLVLISMGAGLYFSGYFFLRAFCRPYSKSEEKINFKEESKVWSDCPGADYEHEEEMARKRTGYFNLFVPTFFCRYL